MGWWEYVTLMDVVILGAVILLLLYYASTRNLDYFAKRNIPFVKPLPLFGNQFRIGLRLQSLPDFVTETYNAFSHYKVAGMFQFQVPVIWIRDPDIIKAITVKDFDHFTDRFSIIPDDIEPLFSANLFSLKGQKWKRMRNLLSPAFTSSKMKGMFHLITDCGQQLADHLETRIKESGQGILEVDMKDVLTRFTTDVIATSAFGVTVDSLKNPTNEFFMCGKDISNFGGIRFMKIIAYMLVPKLMKILNIKFISKWVSDFLYNTISENIENREKNGIVRPDMIHLLMLARKGELRDEESAEKNVDASQANGITDTDIAAQAMIFFLAGFDTVSNMLGFASLLLAAHQDVQNRLQEEIDETLENCGGKITYDALQNMKYLDMVASETLRLYPPLSGVDRECVKPYTIPATENTPAIHVDTKGLVFIPIYAIHHDPQYHPNPEKFDPERFSEENKHKIKPFTYMPFGLGPRLCIGNRFALMENKIALVYLLSRFRLHVTAKSPIPMQFSRNGLQITPENGFWLGLERRRNISA